MSIKSSLSVNPDVPSERHLHPARISIFLLLLLCWPPNSAGTFRRIYFLCLNSCIPKYGWNMIKKKWDFLGIHPAIVWASGTFGVSLLWESFHVPNDNGHILCFQGPIPLLQEQHLVPGLLTPARRASVNRDQALPGKACPFPHLLMLSSHLNSAFLSLESCCLLETLA